MPSITFTSTAPVPGIGLTACWRLEEPVAPQKEAQGFSTGRTQGPSTPCSKGHPRYQSQGHRLQPLDSLAPFWAALPQISARAGSAGGTRTPVLIHPAPWTPWGEACCALGKVTVGHGGPASAAAEGSLDHSASSPWRCPGAGLRPPAAWGWVRIHGVGRHSIRAGATGLGLQACWVLRGFWDTPLPLHHSHQVPPRLLHSQASSAFGMSQCRWQWSCSKHTIYSQMLPGAVTLGAGHGFELMAVPRPEEAVAGTI